MILTNFAANRFRRLFEIFLWILLIAFVIIGFRLGSISGITPLSIIGSIFGGFVGLLLVILVGGFTANFFSLVDNVEKIAQK